jgi:hexosaminidase
MQLRIFLSFIFLLLVLINASFSQEISIIPKPTSVTPREGRFSLDSDTRLYYPKDKAEWVQTATYLISVMLPSTGFRMMAQPIKRQVLLHRSNSIYLIENKEIEEKEGYTLEITPKNIIIQAKNALGAFYAIQSLRQLFPPEINSSTLQANNTIWSAPCCKIEDYPRFQYRGLMLDVSRHFFNVGDVKRFIDLMVLHKFNTFHWHLTDDQGWRIEIPKYPKLRTSAACRNGTLIGHYSDEPEKFDTERYCGSYTKEEIKSVIAYAAQNFVTIIPEIEMPGHAMAALHAYPELGCTGGPYETFKKWGVVDDVFCAGNDKTFEFIETVLTEVAALFPGTYIHVGGDECPKERWKKCQKCQKRMADLGLRDEHELQSYFISRAEKILNKLGKKLIGWDEILEGGLAPNATVMSWRGIDGGIAAAKAHHDVIMSPTDNCYLDYYQSEPSSEPLAIGGFLPIDKVYAYEPIPAVLSLEDAKYIIGVQGNLWTEYIGDLDKVFYMLYPRASALAETAWTSKDLKDWKDFSKRLKKHFTRLEKMNVNHSKGFFDLKASFQSGNVSISSNEPESADIRYTLDGTEPTASSTKYVKPFLLDKTSVMKAAIFSNGKPLGKTLTSSYLVHKASGKSYTLTTKPEKFTGGEEFGLTNGVIGNEKKWNTWVALCGYDFDPIIDLGEITTIKSVKTNFLNSKISWIYPPRAIEILISEDGKTFTSIGKKSIDADALSGISMENIIFDVPNVKGRYLKLLGTHYGKIPAGMPGESNDAWIFLDEIQVD